MDGWRRVSRERPCPICGKPDNCEVSDNGEMVYCGRVEEGSIKQNAGGQFLYRLKDDEDFRKRPRANVVKPKRELPVKPKPDWQALSAQWFNAPTAESHRKQLAKFLAVSCDSLRELEVGFNGTAWTIPERDDERVVIGISRRIRNGRKLRMKDSKSGLTFAKSWNEGSGPILLPEGASDVAALLTMGLNAVGRPGINLDRSGPGYGKSFADFTAMELIVKRGGRVLVVLPTHENCEELETELITRHIDAVAYPGRLIDGEKQNCWNVDADRAEMMGLSAVAAVCPFCPERKRCTEIGYLLQLGLASEATVAIATHSRAIYARLGTLSSGREYVAIHEDSLTVLRPSCSVSERHLCIARDEVLARLVHDPKWLDWYGDILRRDDDGQLIGNDKLRQRRDALREFAILLNELCDWLLKEMADQGRTRRLTTPRTIVVECVSSACRTPTENWEPNSRGEIMAKTVIGYVRVSTKGQVASGLGLEAQ